MVNTFDFISGGRITPMSIDDLHNEISTKIKQSEQTTIVSQNFHSVYLLSKTPELVKMQKQSLVRIDGMPIVFLAKIAGIPARKEHRVTWMDWKDHFFKFCESASFSIFYLGSKEEVCSKALTTLQKLNPKLKIEGHNGYFDKNETSEENQKVIKKINSFNPDILLVGMGMPIQEKWILANKENINSSVILTCGAAMEYLAQDVKVPPRWMGRLGFEWLFRFVENPKRFWFRYLVEGWVVFFLFIKFLIRKK